MSSNSGTPVKPELIKYLSKHALNSITDISMKNLPEVKLENEKQVFVRDSVYAWVPARLLEDIDSTKEKVKVMIELPEDWEDTTVVDPSYTINMKQLIELNEYTGAELPLQNRDKKTGDFVGKSDLADLEHLHEAAMLYNLKDCNACSIPYLRVGDIIIATNPFQWINGLYTERQQKFFADRLIWSQKEETMREKQEAAIMAEEDKKEDQLGNSQLSIDSSRAMRRSSIIADAEGGTDAAPSISKNIYWFTKFNHEPHVYETSSMAYKGMIFHDKNQSILVTGESGAGKTETVKIVLRHLATLPHFQKIHEGIISETSLEDSAGETVVNKVLQSNPVFEAFGNAKTLRNNNSSRFGKFIQLQFDINQLDHVATLSGSKCDTYLLEKSRVVSHDQGERGYHIFYHLLNGASLEERIEIWQDLEDVTVHSFDYLDLPEGEEVPSIGDSDEELWETTRNALASFGVENDLFTDLMRSLCIVLQLGNLVFADDVSSDADASIISNTDELKRLSDLFGLSSENLVEVLTKRLMITNRESIQVTLNKEAAKESCDAFAKQVYAQIFSWLVDVMNDATTAPDITPSKVIHRRTAALLDIFGFEIFQVNRFEQLCINYANERIQQKYVSDIFNEVKTEYEREGIEVFDFSVVDNAPVCELIESRTGVITVLNEECKRPKGNDASFVFKLKALYKDEPLLIKRKLDTPYQFGIKHFAGDVTYNAHLFVEKNMDNLPLDIIECAISSTNTIISKGFQKLKQELHAPKPKANAHGRRTAKPGKTTVISKFKTQLHQLLTTIAISRTRYIRCIKPNSRFLPKKMDHLMTITQLSSAGLVTAVTISRETFPNTLSYEIFIERFRCIAPGHLDIPYKVSKVPGEDYNYDKLKAQTTELLTLLLHDQRKVVGHQLIYPFASGKSKIFFKSGALESLENIRKAIYDSAALTIQKWIRSIIYKIWLVRMKAGALLIQANYRGFICRLRLKRQRSAVMLLQCCVRLKAARLELVRRRQNKAAIVIQTRWRTRSPVLKLRKFIRAARILRRAIRARRDRDKIENALPNIVEKARMDHKLKNLQLSLAMVDNSGRHTEPEKLLSQSQSMLEYLAREVYSLRSEASSLKAELNVSRDKLDELRLHSANNNAAHSAKKLESTRLHQYNKHLKEEIKSYKYENLSLKKSIKEMHEAQRQQISKQNDLFKSMRASHLAEIKKLRTDFLQTKQSYTKEIKKLERSLAQEKESHSQDIKALEDELQTTLDTHNEDLSRMFEALEATQRDDHTLKVVDEYLVTSAQEKQILELKKEIESMKRSHALDIAKLKEGK